MFGSSSTTSSRASGVRGSAELPATVPPVARAGAVVMRRAWRVPAAVALDATCELAWSAPGSAGGRHGPAAPPVADRVVLRPAQPPPAAQVGADRPDGGGLGADPGEDVVPLGPVQRRDGVDQQRALARAACRRGAASAPSTPAGAASGCSSSGPATSSRRRPGVAGAAAARIRLIAGSAVSSPASSSQRGRPLGQRGRRRRRRAARRARAAAAHVGGRPVAVQHEVDLHARPRPGPAGGRCSCAGHAVAALRARRSGRPGWTRGQRGSASPTRGTSRFTVGPAAATAAGVPVSDTRRTDGVTSVTRGDGEDVDRAEPVGGEGRVVTSVEPSSVRNGADPADPGGMESTGPAIADGAAHAG